MNKKDIENKLQSLRKYYIKTLDKYILNYVKDCIDAPPTKVNFDLHTENIKSYINFIEGVDNAVYELNSPDFNPITWGVMNNVYLLSAEKLTPEYFE